MYLIEHFKIFNGNNYDELISLATDMDKTNLKMGNLKLKLDQFYTRVDSRYVSLGKTVKVIPDFDKKAWPEQTCLGGT